MFEREEDVRRHLGGRATPVCTDLCLAMRTDLIALIRASESAGQSYTVLP